MGDSWGYVRFDCWENHITIRLKASVNMANIANYKGIVRVVRGLRRKI